MANDKPTPRNATGPEQEPLTEEEKAKAREEARAADLKAIPASEKPRRSSWLKPLLRIVLLLLVLLFLGALGTYLWLYQPAAQQLQTLRVEATQTADRLQQREAALKQSQQDLEEAKTSATEAQDRLEVELARIAVLRSVNDLTFARMALQSEDKAGVTKALNDSEKQLKDVLPLVEERDPEQASTLRALYTLAKNDLERDLKLAGQDLDRIQSELERVEKNVLNSD